MSCAWRARPIASAIATAIGATTPDASAAQAPSAARPRRGLKCRHTHEAPALPPQPEKPAPLPAEQARPDDSSWFLDKSSWHFTAGSTPCSAAPCSAANGPTCSARFGPGTPSISARTAGASHWSTAALCCRSVRASGRCSLSCRRAGNRRHRQRRPPDRLERRGRGPCRDRSTGHGGRPGNARTSGDRLAVPCSPTTGGLPMSDHLAPANAIADGRHPGTRGC